MRCARGVRRLEVGTAVELLTYPDGNSGVWRRGYVMAASGATHAAAEREGTSRPGAWPPKVVYNVSIDSARIFNPDGSYTQPRSAVHVSQESSSLRRFVPGMAPDWSCYGGQSALAGGSASDACWGNDVLTLARRGATRLR